MKSHGLKRFTAPPPPPPPVCQGCNAMVPTVEVPAGDGAVLLCWLCAHQHVDHDVPLELLAAAPRCRHGAGEIYPMSVLVEREAHKAVEHARRDFATGMGSARNSRPVVAADIGGVDPVRSAAISRGMRRAK